MELCQWLTDYKYFLLSISILWTCTIFPINYEEPMDEGNNLNHLKNTISPYKMDFLWLNEKSPPLTSHEAKSLPRQ